MSGESSITVTHEPHEATCPQCNIVRPWDKATLCWREKRTPEGCGMVNAISSEDVKIWFAVTTPGARATWSDPGSGAEIEYRGCADLNGKPRPDLAAWAKRALQEEYYHRALDAADEGEWWDAADRGYQEAKDRELEL